MKNRIVGYMLEGDNPVPVYSRNAGACERFADWLHNASNLATACTMVRPGLEVSTRFLGINRARYPSKDLVLWETRVIRDRCPEPPHLYSTAAAARTGHWEVVYSLLRGARLPIPPAIQEAIAAHVPEAYRSEGPPSPNNGGAKPLRQSSAPKAVVPAGKPKCGAGTLRYCAPIIGGCPRAGLARRIPRG
jgi:hypothetical protein